MNNSSNSTTDLTTLSLRYWVYVVQGIVLILCNGVIVLAYLFHEVLNSRKELALPVALAFCDAIDGLGAVLAGMGRNWMIWQGTAFDLSSRWACFLKPWNLVWIWTNHVMDPTLLAISCDRLIAVNWPLYHFGLSRSYSKTMVSLAWGPASLLWAYSVYLSYQYKKPERPALCHIEYVFDTDYYKFAKVWRVVLSTASVVVYIVVIVAYFLTQKKRKKREDSMKRRKSSQCKLRAEYEKTQRKVTITLGLSCLFTTFLYVLPQLFRGILPYFVDMSSSGAAAFMSLSYIVENFNKFANIFLYSIRLQNVRMGILYLFLCKELTESALQNAKRNTQQGNLAQLQEEAFHRVEAMANHAIHHQNPNLELEDINVN